MAAFAIPPRIEVDMSAEYMFGSSAARPADHSGWRRLAFYNIGWNKKSKKHNMTLLAQEIWNIVHAKCIDAIGISEVFNLRDDTMRKERQNIMQHLLATLSRSAAQPASSAHSADHVAINSNAEPPAWAGRRMATTYFFGI